MKRAGKDSLERRFAGWVEMVATWQWLHQRDVWLRRAESMQLQNVVGKTDQRPLALDFSQAAQEELAKPAGLFDLAEDRLHDGFLCRIDCPPQLSLKLALHALDPRRLAR